MNNKDKNNIKRRLNLFMLFIGIFFFIRAMELLEEDIRGTIFFGILSSICITFAIKNIHKYKIQKENYEFDGSKTLDFSIYCSKCGQLLENSSICPNCDSLKITIKNIQNFSYKEFMNDYETDIFSCEYDDPIYNEVVDFAVSTGKISASLIQRKFRLGYNRAARIVELLEERGIIGPPNGSKPRDVLIKDTNDLISINKKNEENIMLNYNIKVDYSNNIHFDNIKNSLFLIKETENQHKIVNSIIKYISPNLAKIIFIDCSKLTFNKYDKLPHLLMPIIIDINRIAFTLKDIMNEIDRRYELFLKLKVKDIEEFNNKITTIEEKHFIPLSQIFIISDELFYITQKKENLELLTNLLLSSEKAGIKFILFSRINKKYLRLGPTENLLKIHNENEIDEFIHKIINNV